VLAETSETRREELVALVDQRTAASEQRFEHQVNALSEDAEMGYRLLQSQLERMYNSSLAMASR
jgi:hypothetical protein